MDRTAELLEIAQEWKALAKTTLMPAVRQSCSEQRTKVLEELLQHRDDLHHQHFKCMFEPISNRE